MPGKASGGRSSRRQAARGPVFVVPPEMDRKTRRQVQTIITSQAAAAKVNAGLDPPRPFRFRYQLAWLAWLGDVPAALWFHVNHRIVFGCAWALLQLAVAVAATRHRGDFPRLSVQLQAAWSSLWVLLITVAGWPGGWMALGFAGWFIPWCFWLEHYRWRPKTADAPADTSVFDTWRELCEVRKWHAWLGNPQAIGNGMQYTITCKGTRTHIGDICVQGLALAAAYGAAVTECYAEPHPSGKQHLGILTILKSGTLEAVRHWDGKGADAEGFAVTGRFPDGMDVHERIFVPGIGGGARHTIIAGADGSGKTGAINLGLAVSARTPVIAPVILDPQHGQALPAWRDRVPYAAGPEECMAFLRGLKEGMMLRSQALAVFEWSHPKTGRRMRGIDFFDPLMTGLPIIEITIDELPILLAFHKDAPGLLLDIAKLGRKAGFRLRMAAQVPSLKELKLTELRSIMNGGNVFCFRTGDKVTSGMLNITAEPHRLPKYFPDRQPTRGLGYCDTIEDRSSVPYRGDWLEDPYEVADTATIREPDPLVAGCIADALASMRAGAAQEAAGEAAIDQAQAHVMHLLLDAGEPMAPADLVAACAADGYSLAAVTLATGQLLNAGKIRKLPGGELEAA
jgi:hypothetical protein